MTGESASAEVLADVRSVLQSDPRVMAIDDLLSMHLGPQDILLALSIDFRDDMTSAEIEDAARELSDALQDCHKSIKRVFLRPLRKPDQPA